MSSNPHEPKRVVLYGRSSLGSPPVGDQMEFLRDWAHQQGHTIVEEFSDDQVSGVQYDRQGLSALYARLGKSKQGLESPVDWVVTKRLDRLGRDTRGNLEVVQKLKQVFGVEYVSATENMFNTYEHHGELFISIFSAFADYERKLFHEKTKEGRILAKRRGVQFGRPFNNLEKENLMTLRENGMSHRQLAEHFKVSRRTISRRFELWGDPKKKKEEGVQA